MCAHNGTHMCTFNLQIVTERPFLWSTTAQYKFCSSCAFFFSYPRSNAFFQQNTSGDETLKTFVRARCCAMWLHRCRESRIKVTMCPLEGHSGSCTQVGFFGFPCVCWLVCESNLSFISDCVVCRSTSGGGGFRRGGRSESRAAGPRCSWPSETRPASGTATRPPARGGRWSDAGSSGPGWWRREWRLWTRAAFVQSEPQELRSPAGGHESLT